MRELNPSVKIELPASIVDAFVNHFKPLNQKVPGLASRLMDFLLEGKEAGALDDLRKVSDAAPLLKLGLHSSYNAGENPIRASAFFNQRFEPLELYHRLSVIWENAAAMLARNPVLAGLPDEGRWFETFIWEFQARRHGFWTSEVPPIAVTADDIEQIFVWRRQPPEWLVRSGLYLGDRRRGYGIITGYFKGVPKMGDAYVRHKATVVDSLKQKDHIAREVTLDQLAIFEETLEPYADVWAECAVNSAKGIRERAVALLQRKLAPALPHLQKWASEGSPVQKGYAFAALAKVSKNEARDFLQSRLKEEKAPKVVEAIQEALDSITIPEPETISIPDKGEHEIDAPLSPIVSLDESANEVLRKFAITYQELAMPMTLPRWRLSFTEGEVSEMIRFMERFTYDDVEALSARKTRIITNDRDGKMRKLFSSVAAHPTFQFIHLLRWQLFTTDYWRQTREFNASIHTDYLLTAFEARGGEVPDLKTQARIIESMGYDGKRYATGYLYKYGPSFRPLAYQMPLEKTLSFFSENIEVIENILSKQNADRRQEYMREISFTVLQALPKIPQTLVSILWDIALNGKKKERPLAQAVLNRYPDKNEKILKALGKSKSDLRSNALEWIVDLKDASFLPALKEALAIEKQESTRIATQMAIQQIGGTEKDLGLKAGLDVKALDSEMAKLVEKGRPKQLNWVVPKSFPKVRWAKSGKPVSVIILEGLIIQAFRLKNPEPGPELRRICGAMHEGDREKLSEILFKAWVADDERERYSENDARREAAQTSGNWSGPAFDKAFKACKEKMEDSSSASKGVFAVIGACSSGSIASSVFRYIKKWFGRRLHQGKALVEMLASIDDLRATQALLALGYRFRTKGIRELASERCLLIAQKKGWTLDQLSDRTIPSAGFDDEGRMDFDYGTRTFSAILQANWEIKLLDQAGQEIPKLPDARKDDDADAVKEAKADFSQAKRDIRGLVKIQTARLYEAMCTQRSWESGDWQTYLLKHPVAGVFCQRLIWQVIKGPHVGVTFRALPDRTLTDSNDDPVILAPENQLILAHSVTVPKAASEAWLTHLTDYNVETLFGQFGTPVTELSETDRKKEVWPDFVGHIVMSLTLGRVLTARGYDRGPMIEGTFFNEYRKHFPGKKLDAVIEFTGASIEDGMNEDAPTALKKMWFAQHSGDGINAQEKLVPLGEVPPIILSECLNDLRLAAAAGSGFDPDWEKKVGY